MKQKKIIYFTAFLLSLSFIFLLEASSLKLLTENIKPLRKEEVKIELLSISKKLSEENDQPKTVVKTQRPQEKQKEDKLKKKNEINKEVDNNILEKEMEAITPAKNQTNEKVKSEKRIIQAENRVEVENNKIEDDKDQKKIDTEEMKELKKDQNKAPSWLKNTESEKAKDNSKSKVQKTRDKENKFDLEKYLAGLKKEEKKNKKSQIENNQNFEQISLNESTINKTKEDNKSIERAKRNNSNNSEPEENNPKIKKNKVYDLRNSDLSSIKKPGIKNYLKPKYPSNLRRRNIEGEVIVSLRVDEEGQVHNLKVYQSSGYNSFDQSALNAISSWEFKAAEKDGNKVEVIVNLPIRFKLN
ncbi:TonB family protein [Halanaerobium saccharolyticum]|uniref:TonB family protein n=1 Tax=Halanaerobium saccharolyticum TaxID=43595 RepID=A0A4R7ZA71_9FIRM|nr:energy transducer TonB [Halanaerobium saccharolyticum]RAK11101.1 TonB family protein [Halanaerobium saccharolyticum]TDW06952.1 TonB family protein [Halanaerobium saccharolyticum]TDX63717.1 TonB family protein [Halanaerobium saccharolyticum]